MTPLPPAGFFDAPTPPKVGPTDQYFEDLRAAIAEIPGMSADGDPLVIATGVITPSLGSHRVDTEAAATADDLTNIDPTAVPDGRWLLIRATDPARVVTVRHGAAGIGQILLADGQPYVLSAARQFLALKLTNNIWEEVFRSIAGDLGTAAKKNTGTASGNVPVLGSTGMPAVSGESLTDIPRFGNFAPSQQAAANMTLLVKAGSVQVATTLVKVAAQSSATIAAPTAHPRNDIVYVDAATGVIGVAAGTENATPADPGMPTGKLPIARLRLTVGQTSIKSADFDDLRQLPVQQAAGGMKNRIINGGMDIAQRGTSFAVGGYTVDRWGYNNSSAAVATVSQISDGPVSLEFQSALQVAITTADAAIAAADQLQIRQIIEGYNIRDLIGRDVTLSFWVRSPKAGVHCVSFRNSGTDRSYVLEYTVAVANAWQNIAAVIPGGLITAGSWDWMNGKGLYVTWALGAGATWQSAAGAWQTGNFIATANQVNCLDTIGNTFAITGVQLEAGSAATPFEHRPAGTEFALCQRYFEKSYDRGVFPGDATSNFSGAVRFDARAADQNTRPNAMFKTSKRGTPTVVIYDIANGAAGFLFAEIALTHLAAIAGTVGENLFVVHPTANTVSAARYAFHWTADAEL